MNAIIVGSISAQKAELVLSFTKIFVSISGFLNHKSFSESLFGKIIISLSIHQDSNVFQLNVAIALFQSIKISEYNQSIYFSSNVFKATSLSIYF
jgi:hypothetical protein